VKIWKDVAEAVRNGQRIHVELTGEASNQEGCLEPGMRGILVAYKEEGDEVLSFSIDLSSYDAHNRPLETAQWTSPKGDGLVTAREAGHYPVDGVESLWVGESAHISELVRLLDADALSLYQEYLATPRIGSYSQWLEGRVRRFTGAGGCPVDLLSSGHLAALANGAAILDQSSSVAALVIGAKLRELLALLDSAVVFTHDGTPESTTIATIKVGSFRVERVTQKDGPMLWAARTMFGACLSTEGELVDEPMPSNRTPRFLALCRFPSAYAALTAVQDYSRTMAGRAPA